MKTITVEVSEKYNVLIDSGLISKAGSHIAEVATGRKAAIISDSNVWPLYGETLSESLISSGFEVIPFTFSAGEASKNATTYLAILNFLAEKKVTRSDIMIALGGGVVGDITGFAAATYLRGIDYIQIPTTMLAMVDSSVGGKTAIDLPAGKNLVGAFKQPKLVLCDITALDTLPTEIYLDGCAEVIKYGMLYDAELIDYLHTSGPDFDHERVIAKCVTFKRNVVQEDEFDTGARQKLNLGHTLGHGIEAESNFAISHGKAVAAGMAIITKSAVANGLCDQTVYSRLCAILEKFSLPTCTTFSAEQLFSAALSDKKRSCSCVNLIVPAAVGCCKILATPIHELESFIKAGL